MSDEIQEINSDEPCPCESGDNYGPCCKQKKFLWGRGPDGELYKSAPVSEELSFAINGMRKDYFRVLGRAPAKDDPLFLGQYLHGWGHYQREICEAMEHAELPPQFIYAYKKTGRLIGEQSVDMLPDKELAEWDEAINEYFENEGRPTKISSSIRALERIEEEIENCIIVIGYILENGASARKKPTACASKFMSPEHYSMFLLASCAQTLRSIKFLLEQSVGVDVYTLSRSLYESYIHINYVKINPDAVADLFDAVAGLEMGTHDYAVTNSGKTDRRRIIEKTTGIVFKGQISNYSMVASFSSDLEIELFDYLYNILSGYTHPSPVRVSEVVNRDGSIDHRLTGLSPESYLLPVAMSAMLLDSTSDCKLLTARAKRDLYRLSKRMAKKVSRYIRQFIIKEKDVAYMRILATRLERICDAQQSAAADRESGG